MSLIVRRGGSVSRLPTLGGETQTPLPPCQFTFVDKTGAQITTERYDYARDFSEGLAPVRVGGKWGYV